MKFEGILPVWKPAGMTSHDVVAKVRRIIREKRIGHTGTLDPDVTGVLPLCIGRATRLVEYIQELPKQYEATLKIGIATDTEDLSGHITSSVERVELTEAQVREAAAAFLGEIEQIPPMYSAVRVDGKRLYELARAGVEVERKARTVHIYAIDSMECNLQLSHPEIKFRVTCSKGTYIRTLCVDIGKKLGYPAVMAGLIRTATGFFTQDRCFTLIDIERLTAEGNLQEVLVPVDEAIQHLDEHEVGEEEARRAAQGRTVSIDQGKSGTLYRLYGPKRLFLGIFRCNHDGGQLLPEKVFN